MASDGVPEQYMDVLFQEFAYDPIRLSPAEDPAQMLYNRRTLETIWVTKHEAINPYTRHPFHINNVIPQTELRQQMHQYATQNRIRGLEVIPDYTQKLKKSDMENLLKDFVFHYCHYFSQKEEKEEEDWKVLWQKVNLIRLYCQYKEDNKGSFLLIKGYKYLFVVIDTHLLNSLWEWFSSCDDAREVCWELARIVDIIGLTQDDLETIPEESVKSFVHILFNLVGSDYLKIDSMVLKIYCQIFYYGIGYAVGNKKTFRPCVIDTVLNLLGRNNTRDITDEDLENGTAIFQAAWMCKRNALLYFQHYVDIVVNVVILCISRFREHVAVVPRGGSHGRALAISIALTRGLQLIQYIATAKNLEGEYNYDYQKGRLQSLDIVKDIVGMVELVVAGFEFSLFHVRVGLNIINALCKSGLRVMRSDELRVLADFLGSEIVNNYDANVKELLHEITYNRV